MTESTLNIQAIKAYSELVSNSIIADFFKAKKTISGNEILSLSSIKQINYFVLKNLFTKWQSEVSRLESPFFNYKKDDVRKSMQQLMNVLSKNIVIEEDNFQPILTESISETLFITLSPYDYYHKNIEKSPSLTIKYLRSQAKYIRINKHLYMLLLDALENETEDKVLDKRLVYEKLDGIFKSTAEGPEDIDNYISELSKIEPLKAGDFFVEDITLTATEEAEIDEIQNHLFQGFEEMDEVAIEKSRQQLNDRFANEQKTLNDKLAIETVDIATAHVEKKVDSIHKSISVNQRYLFVKELFDGQSDAFDSAITEINDCDTFEDAVGLLVQNYAKVFHWNMQSTEIKDLLKIIIKKFK